MAVIIKFIQVVHCYQILVISQAPQFETLLKSCSELRLLVTNKSVTLNANIMPQIFAVDNLYNTAES